MHTHMHIHIHTHTCTHTHVHIHMHTHTHARTHAHTHTHTHYKLYVKDTHDTFLFKSTSNVPLYTVGEKYTLKSEHVYHMNGHGSTVTSSHYYYSRILCMHQCKCIHIHGQLVPIVGNVCIISILLLVPC